MYKKLLEASNFEYQHNKKIWSTKITRRSGSYNKILAFNEEYLEYSKKKEDCYLKVIENASKCKMKWKCKKMQMLQKQIESAQQK